MSETLAVLDSVLFPIGSARGIQHPLEPIAQAAQLARTVNGALLDLTRPQFRKYKTTLTCKDQAPPALDGVWPARQGTLSCGAELIQSVPASTTSLILGRPAVAGSVWAEDAAGAPLTVSATGTDGASGNTSVTLATNPAGAMVHYRPILVVRLGSWRTDFDEWNAEVGWTIELEEI